MKNQITVIIPTYNDSPERLNKTVSSVINQSFKEIEIIVVDDGSQKPFGGLDLELKDKRIIWLKMKQNSGVAKARNYGLLKASGKYVAFLDTGDWWEPGKLSEQIQKFQKTEQKNCVLIYSSAKAHYPNGTEKEIRAQYKGKLYPASLVKIPISGSCSSALVLRSAINDAGGFYELQDIPEDKELWVRLSKIGTFDFVSKVQVHLESTLPGSRSFYPEAMKVQIYNYNQLYKEELKKNRLYRKAWSVYHGNLANKFFITGSKWQALCHWSKRLYYQPSFGGLIQLILMIFSVLFKKNFLEIRENIANRVSAKNNLKDE